MRALVPCVLQMHSKCVLVCRSGTKWTQKHEREKPHLLGKHGESLLFCGGSFHLGSGEVPPSPLASAWWSRSRPSHSHYSLQWKAAPVHLDADRDCNYDDGGEAGKTSVESGGEQLVTKRGGGHVDLFSEMLQGTSDLSFSVVWKVEPDRTWHMPESSVVSSCSFASVPRKLKGKKKKSLREFYALVDRLWRQTQSWCFWPHL